MHLFNTAISLSEFKGYLNREIVLKLRNGISLKGVILKVLDQGTVESERADNLRHKALYEAPVLILFQQNDDSKEIEVKVKDIHQFEFIY